VLWAEFDNAFCTHYIPVGVTRKKCQEFMDLKQGGRSVHNYSKQFNHLMQYAPDQVDTDEKNDPHVGTRAVFPARLGRQAKAHVAFRLAMHERLPHHAGCSPGRFTVLCVN
jgi:hypothetical protein